jgi:hypothetical protein
MKNFHQTSVKTVGLRAEIKPRFFSEYAAGVLTSCPQLSTNKKMAVFWEVLMIETVSSSETSVNFYQRTWANIPEGSLCSLCKVKQSRYTPRRLLEGKEV